MEKPVSHCRACKAPIIWVKNAKGTSQRLDAVPVPEGTIEVVDGVARVVPQADRERLLHTPLYMPHHATCPQTAKFRRGKQS